MQWQAHIVMMISRAPPIVETTQDRISPLSLLFSAKFRRDMCQDLDTSSHVLHSLLATDYSFPLSLRSRNSAIAKALQNVSCVSASVVECECVCYLLLTDVWTWCEFGCVLAGALCCRSDLMYPCRCDQKW